MCPPRAPRGGALEQGQEARVLFHGRRARAAVRPMIKLATFGIYAGIVVFALLFVLVVVPWLLQATGASPEMISIATASISFLVGISSYIALRNMAAKK